jgi:hypothetical protein
MLISSDPNYVPAANDERVLSSAIYRQLLSVNIDPYASPRDEGLIQMVEDHALTGGFNE